MAYKDCHDLQTGDIQEWSSGLFDCCQDPSSCVLGTFCPFVLFGQNVEALHGRNCCCPCMIAYLLSTCIFFGSSIGASSCWAIYIGPSVLSKTLVSCYTCRYRTKMRSKYHLPNQPMGDWVTHFLCQSCALCQEYREIKARPFNLSGGNVDFVMTAPAVPEILQAQL